MNKTLLIVGVAAFSIGFGLGFIVPTSSPEKEPVVVQKMDHNEEAMIDMTAALKDKSGKEFDNEFLHEMILHHAGAIEMAKMAKEKAASEDIKKMADEIIEAQSREVKTMKEWHDKVHEEVKGIH